MIQFLGLAAAAGVWFVPLPLSPEAHRLAAILFLVAFYWVTEAAPLAATSLLGMALCVVAGVADAKTVFAPFADPIMFLML
ncbi:MAG: anion permease, partial [bacterium]